jgi:hypothetical protein
MYGFIRAGEVADGPAHQVAHLARRHNPLGKAIVLGMPTAMEQHILALLGGMKAGDRPLTLGDIARQSGASYDSIARCARLMVDTGLAKPAMIPVRGTPRLHGLLPQPATEPAP